MLIRKLKGGVEDLTFGMAQELQYRVNKSIPITQINSSHIPYTETVSIEEELIRQTAEDAQIRIDKFNKADHIIVSVGAVDTGKPVILNSAGLLDPTLLGSGTYPVGMFTPVNGAEYPDTTGEEIGAYWIVEGVDTALGYTFLTGDLTGKTVENGNLMVWTVTGWAITPGLLVPSDYYRLDGTQSLEAPFAGGNQQLKNIADGADPKDAATKGQMDAIDLAIITAYEAEDIAIRNEHIRRDGSNTFTGNADLGGFKVSQLGLGVDPTDAACISQIFPKSKEWFPATTNLDSYTTDGEFAMVFEYSAGLPTGASKVGILKVVTMLDGATVMYVQQTWTTREDIFIRRWDKSTNHWWDWEHLNFSNLQGGDTDARWTKHDDGRLEMYGTYSELIAVGKDLVEIDFNLPEHFYGLYVCTPVATSMPEGNYTYGVTVTNKASDSFTISMYWGTALVADTIVSFDWSATGRWK